MHSLILQKSRNLVYRENVNLSQTSRYEPKVGSTFIFGYFGIVQKEFFPLILFQSKLIHLSENSECCRFIEQ